MKLFNFRSRLQFEFTLFIYLGAFILLMNFPLVYLELKNVNQRILNLEVSEDLYNTILEIRRYEKNYFLYHDTTSLEYAKEYLSQAEEILSQKISYFMASSLAPECLILSRGLKQYAAFDIFKDGASGISPENRQNEVRRVGKTLVDLSRDILEFERLHIAKAAQNALRLPFAFMGVMFILFLAGARLITRKVIKPLQRIEKATENVARGDFRPIPHSGRMDSEVDHLIVAFNRMAKELEAREEQIIHSRKIASLGTLVSGIAHELNNPINNIVLTVDSLVGRRKVSKERREILLKDILTQALRASEIVKNLLEFSRAETSGYEKLELGALVRETIHIAKNHITLSGIKLTEDIEDNLPEINGNRQGLQQVFLNLITNAVHAMPEGGELSIRVFSRGSKIISEVRDTGVGITPEHLPHIFDPFFTTKNVGEGTGLGLSVSYGIIKKHGGQITVKSKPGRGTTFTVTLPMLTYSGRETMKIE